MNTGKCTTIKVNVILVAIISPFSTLHIVHFQMWTTEIMIEVCLSPRWLPGPPDVLD